jgi:hypothetical protein
MAKEAPLTINHVFAGIAVADYDSALAWYKRFFGRPPDVTVTENESMWQGADTAWIYVVGIPTLTAIDPEFNTPANGVGFAIPANRVKAILPQFIQG